VTAPLNWQAGSPGTHRAVTMQTIQQKITDAVRKIIELEPANLTLVEDATSANTGRWYLMDGLVTLLTIDYNFQDGYGSFSVAGPDTPNTEQAKQDFPHLEWTDPVRLMEFISCLHDMMNAYAEWLQERAVR